MITVINLKIGNIASVSRALKRLGLMHIVSDNLRDIEEADKLILPGVGSFSEAAKRIKGLGIDALLKYKVLTEKTPILGICLGMQLLASFGEEGGMNEGLGLIKGKVVYHRASLQGLRLPHIGWNDVHFENGFKIFEEIKNNSCFYFVHSFEFIPAEAVEVATACYGVDFVALIQKGHILGTQFHPEKSQEAGLKLLKNFCEGSF